MELTDASWKSPNDLGNAESKKMVMEEVSEIGSTCVPHAWMVKHDQLE